MTSVPPSVLAVLLTAHRLCLPKFIFVFVFLTSFVISNKANAVDVTITGPTTVCPDNSITYTANAYELPAGWEVNSCEFAWHVYKGDEIVGSGFGKNFSYTFGDVGTYQVKVGAATCWPYNGGTKTITVNSRIVVPNPISGPSMCVSGQSYSFTTSPGLPSQNPYGSECFYHYEYLWTAPSGWSINGGGNTLFSHSETVGIKAPVNTPAGSYSISVQASMPNQGYSDPRTYTVQVGPFAVSQVSVSGTSMVCSGNAYTYTADVPGGHKSGYTYSWTYPSGWTVQNTSTNTIRLYVPSNNSSYGTVRVSVNNGCGATVFTGRTVYPCNYMMSTGSFKVYPNPARNELNIENLADSDNYSGSAQREDAGSSESKAFRVEVFDHAEQMVKSGKSKDGKVLLDISGLRAGTYFLHIYDGKKVVREQILIQ